MKSISDREFSLINLIFGIIILLSIIYISLNLVNDNQYKTISSVRESRLNLSIGAGNNSTSYANDIKTINESINQENIDQNLLTKGLNPKNYLMKESYGVVVNTTRLAYQEKTTDLLDQEIKSSTQLSKAEVINLTAQVQQLKTNLKLIKAMLSTANHLQKSLLQKENEIFPLQVSRLELLKIADDQQASEIEISKLSKVFIGAINNAAYQGVNVTNLRADLTTVNSDIKYGRNISSSIETSLVNLSKLPTMKKFQLLNNQLATGKRDILAALNAAKSIINDLESS